jgi:hypothetical protein
MQPQGSAIINAAYYTSLTNAVNKAGSCAELQQITNTIMQSLEAELAAVAAQQALLAPIAALLSPPSSPTDVVTWVTSFITNVLVVQYKPYITYASQLTATAAAIVTLTAAINNAASRFPSCTITTP